MFMKKIGKGLLMLGLGLTFVATGCSCDDGNSNPPTQENYDEDKLYGENYQEYSESLQGIYEECKKSTVAIYAYNSSFASPRLGSGVVFKEENGYAYIITNAHVLFAKYDDKGTTINREYTDTVEVLHSNFNKVRAVVMGYDRDEDVAVLRINASENYEVATIVSSDSSTKIGESVFTIGAPHGNLFSMTSGVIESTKIKTGLDYVSRENDDTTFVYNSTATINTGNSGGPLFNAKGEVVAINTMYPKDNDNSVYRNYNYSIPAKHFVDVANHVIGNGNNSYKRVSLNISGEVISTMTISRRNSLGITVDKGIYVTSSTLSSKVIVAVGGNPIYTINDLEYELFTKYANASSVEITVVDKIGTNRNTYTLALTR